ncbi:putative tail fiber, putative capsid and scaffold protein [Staphylococcus phage KSAP7]|nr:putative tail fiber, putative capsid and scaffold protein [Staphylococcus phage KSAP7]BBM81486.1 putative tail fiber, putative capsid and scaffold protein [Staphylococcus phage KSAP11]
MALNFTPITENSTIADLTKQVNNIGSVLTEDRNIFEVTTDLQLDVSKAQKVKLTTDRGLAKDIDYTNYLRDIKKVGLYYIGARTLSTMYDKPDMENIDVLLQVLTLDTEDRVIQILYTLSTADSKSKVMHRFVTNYQTSQWQVVQSLPNNKYTSHIGGSPFDINTQGTYYVSNMSDMPSGVYEGFLQVSIDNNDNRMLRLTDSNTGKEYLNVKKAYDNWGAWRTDLDVQKISKYLLSNVDGDAESNNYSLSVYTTDNITFQQAIAKHIEETSKTVFTFYIQGGVSGSPSTVSCRGIFISDSNNYTNLYGVYTAIGTDGRTINGSVNGNTWNTTKTLPGFKELWNGAHNFKDTNKKETMSDSISNYQYVEIYTRYRALQNTKGTDKTGTLCHKFYIDGDGIYTCSGAYVSGDSNIGVEYYRVTLSITGDTWTIKDSAVNNNKDQYVTRVVGISLP